MSDYKRILCVVDLSQENRQIIGRAVELAKHYSASLEVLHVVEHLPSEVANNIVLPDQMGIEEHLAATAKDELAKVKSEFDMPEMTVKVVVGSTKHEIIDIAQQTKTDLIVIGRHGRHGISRLLGSTANAVLHHAPCDVLAIHVGT